MIATLEKEAQGYANIKEEPSDSKKSLLTLQDVAASKGDIFKDEISLLVVNVTGINDSNPKNVFQTVVVKDKEGVKTLIFVHTPVLGKLKRFGIYTFTKVKKTGKAFEESGAQLLSTNAYTKVSDSTISLAASFSHILLGNKMLLGHVVGYGDLEEYRWQ